MFSKIKTKTWPSNAEILEKMTDYLQKCTLVVEVRWDEEELQGMDEQEREQRLKGINVTLKPLR